MAAVMQADLEPQSNAWKTFYLRNKPVAYGTDATAGTTPVWQRLANLDQAKSNYGPIVYNKAPSVVAAAAVPGRAGGVEQGVRAFLAAHPYGNATWQALLGSIGTAAGRDLTPWGKQWMLRPGHADRHPAAHGGERPHHAPRARAAAGAAVAVGPGGVAAQAAGRAALRGCRAHTAGRDPDRTDRRYDTGAAAVGRPAPAYVYANDGDYGYAIVLPDAASIQWLEAHVETVADDFERAMLWGSMWDLVREAQFDPQRYAAMVLRALPRERDEQLAGTLAGRLATIVSRYSTGATQETLIGRVEPLLLAGAADSSRSYGIRKTHLDRYIGLARTPAALGSCASGWGSRPWQGCRCGRRRGGRSSPG